MESVHQPRVLRSAWTWSLAWAAWGAGYSLLEKPEFDSVGPVAGAIRFGLLGALAAGAFTAGSVHLEKRFPFLVHVRSVPETAWIWALSWAALAGVYSPYGRWALGAMDSALLFGPFGALAGSTYAIELSRIRLRNPDRQLGGIRVAQIGAAHGSLVLVMLVGGFVLAGAGVDGTALLSALNLFGGFGALSAVLALARREPPVDPG